MHVTFDESNPSFAEKEVVNDDADKRECSTRKSRGEPRRANKYGTTRRYFSNTPQGVEVCFFSL